jgi:hypothetical protein
MFSAAFSWRTVTTLLLATLGVGTLGCGSPAAEDLPKTYEVRGVVLKSTGEKLTGGSVEFTPKQPGGQRFNCRINSDGTLSATTITASGSVAGAPEGAYTAVVIPPISNEAQGQHEGRPIKIAEEFTVSASGENNFTIRLPASGT